MGIFARRFESAQPAEDGNAWRLLGSVAANRLYQQGAMLLILVLTARWLGPEGRGLLAAAIAWVQLAGTATGLSLGKVAFQYGAETKQGAQSGSLLTTMAASFAIAYGTLLSALLVASLLGGHLLEEFPALVIVLIALTIPLFVWEDFAFYLLSSQSLLAKNLTIVSIGRTASIILVVLLVGAMPMGVAGAMAALLVGQAISSFWTLSIVRRQVSGPYGFNATLMKEVIGRSIRLHPQTIAATVIGASDVVLLHAMRGESEAGLYQAAWALVAIPVFASTPVGNVLYQLIAEKGPDGAWAQQAKLMKWAIAVAALVSCLAWAFAPSVIPLIFGEAFTPSAAILIGLIPFGFAQILSNLMTPQWIGRGLFVPFSILTVTIAALSVALNYVLIPDLGAWGAVRVAWITAAAIICMNGGLAIWIAINNHRFGSGR